MVAHFFCYSRVVMWQNASEIGYTLAVGMFADPALSTESSIVQYHLRVERRPFPSQRQSVLKITFLERPLCSCALVIFLNGYNMYNICETGY